MHVQTRAKPLRGMWVVLLLVGCNNDPGKAPGTGVAPNTLSPTQHLSRASIALRGVRPSLDDLEAVRDNPGALDGLIESYAASDDIGPTIRHMHGEWLLTDVFLSFYPAAYPTRGALSDMDAHALNRAVTEGTARLAEHIVLEDRPYSELVTADYVMANDVTAEVWGLSVSGDGDWQEARFDDGRLHSGLLSDPNYFVRHASTDTNRQRARSAHLMRALLCHDYMRREVRVPEGIDLTDGGDNAIKENVVCVGCHNTLDPMAGAFAENVGVVFPQYTWSYPITTWDPGLAADYDPILFYGVAAHDVLDVGQIIAEDNRFARCAVRRHYGQMMAMDADAVPDSVVDDLLPVWTAGDERVRPLLAEIARSDAFASTGPVVVEDGVAAEGLRRATPWHLQRVLEDLTGFRWETDVTYDIGFGRVGEVELMDNISYGFRVHAGGADGFDIWDPMRTANPTTLLVMREAAGMAAKLVVEADLVDGEGHLLTRVSSDTSDETSIRTQLVDLHLRLFGEAVSADGSEVTASWTVFANELERSDSVTSAWEATLFAMLQDPNLLFY